MKRGALPLNHGVMLAACLALAGCTQEPGNLVQTGAADRERGASAIHQYGCGACHRIPGIAGADGNVGPALAGLNRRVYLAGVLPNTPENLARWIRAPQAIAPLTAMPDMQVTEADAKAIAAYLYQKR